MDAQRDIFVEIAEGCSCEEKLLGLTSREWLLRGLKGLAHGAVGEGETRSERYVARIRDDMCLVTAEALNAALCYLVKRGDGAVRLGDNGDDICLVDRSKTGRAAKKSLCSTEFLSLSSGENVQVVYNKLRTTIVAECVRAGARVRDWNTVWIDATVKLEQGVTVQPMTVIEGATRVATGTTLGPYALVRGSVIGANCRIGSFVEIKNSTLGDGVKCAHLVYVGDATVGAGTNLGCGTVFCNYDGQKKHRTEVGENCFIGANTNLIAPLTVGRDAFVAAGATVTEDVPEQAFVVARARQITKPARKTASD